MPLWFGICLWTTANLYFQHENCWKPPTGKIKHVEVQQHLQMKVGNQLIGRCKTNNKRRHFMTLTQPVLPHLFWFKSVFVECLIMTLSPLCSVIIIKLWWYNVILYAILHCTTINDIIIKIYLYWWQTRGVLLLPGEVAVCCPVVGEHRASDVGQTHLHLGNRWIKHRHCG